MKSKIKIITIENNIINNTENLSGLDCKIE